MFKKVINTSNAPAPIGPYNQSVWANGFLFISGQIAINPSNGSIEAATITDETVQVMKNLEAILKEAGLNFSHVVKTSIFLTDMDYFATVNEVYAAFFIGDHPARETLAVKALPRGVHVEISMIAQSPDPKMDSL